MNLMKRLRSMKKNSVITIDDADAKRESIRAECSLLKKRLGYQFTYMYVRSLRQTIVYRKG